jgi:tripartite ATP-independent transporter DctM subunit
MDVAQARVQKAQADSNGHLLERLERRCVLATRPVAFLGVIGMLVAAGATVVDVLLRWLANSGITALNEIVALSFAVAVSACIPSGLSQGVNLTVDLLQERFTRRAAAWLQAIGALALCVFFALLAWRVWVYAGTLKGNTTVIRGWPMSPFFYTAAVLLGVGTLVQALVTANRIRVALSAPKSASRSPLTAAATITGAILIVLALWIWSDFAVFARWAQAHPATMVLAAFAVLWLALLMLVPLAAIMGLAGVVGTAAFMGMNPSLGAFATEATGFLANYQVASLPLFLLMGSFAAVSGISEDLYRLAQALFGSFRGGLAMATVGGCAGFGAVTGSSLPTVATFGRIALPEMKARGYSPELANGCVAAGGTLGALIPPSTPLIVFALLTESSIGQLFVAAIVPGLIATLLYLLTIGAAVRLQPGSVPPAVKAGSGELLAALRRSGAVVALFGVVIGGMYSGVFTSTEAAAVGAFGAFLLALVRGRLHRGVFWGVMADTTASTAMIYGLIFGVLIFSFFIGVTDLPGKATAFVGQLDVPKLAIVAIILVVYLLFGSIMDSFTVMIITVPIVTPIILHMGYDMIWWGVINLVAVEIGLVTPPFGMNLFVLKSLVPDAPLASIYRGVLPFCIADFLKLALLVLFPILSLWLPSTMFR